MGWTSIYSNLNNKEFVKHYLTDPRVIDTAIVGNEVYQLAMTGDKQNLYIRVTILSRKDGQVFYKDMDESCGPFYYKCPARILNRSTQNDPRSIEWRGICRDQARLKKEKNTLKAQVKALAKGSRVEMISGRVVVFEFPHNRARFAGRLAEVAPGKQNSLFAWSYKDVAKIL